MNEIEWAALAAALKKRAEQVRHQPNTQATSVTHTASLAASIILEQLADAIAEATK
jgi:hypothetical protein